MLSALKALGGRFTSWVIGEGGRNFGKQLAVNQTSKAAMKHSGGNPSMGTDMVEAIDRGHKKVGGFWGGVAISVAIGVGVSLLVPGAGFIAVGLAQGIGTNVVEGAIGVMAGEDEEPTPTPTPTTEPVEENLPPVSGTDPEPTQAPQVIVVQTTPSHQDDVDIEEPCDSSDPHGGCYEAPHEEPPDMEH
ncbi:MAG: hypothetical protein WD646_14880 [Actinomycetota bacterium]